MSLSIEQVRDCKFHLARRNGYEPVDVDNFVDQVEETLVSLNQQIEQLKRQGGGAPAEGGVSDQVVAEKDAEIERLRAELAAARDGESQDVAGLRADLDSKHQQLGLVQADLDSHRDQLADLRQQMAARDDELSAVKSQLHESQQQLVNGKTERLVLTSAPEASSAVARLLEMATQQSDELLSGAKSEADRLVSEAQARADQTRADADAHAEATRAKAGAEADRTLAEATDKRNRLEAEHNDRKAALDQEITDRRNSLIWTLEQEHGHLASRVAALRDYEANYRAAMTESLARHIDNVKNDRLEPDEKPELLSVEPGTPSTPRLDTLMRKAQEEQGQ